jgi:hypothetical protein
MKVTRPPEQSSKIHNLNLYCGENGQNGQRQMDEMDINYSFFIHLSLSIPPIRRFRKCE